MRKGILLAGGSNSRLYPGTQAVAKSLLLIYDKPLIYYSLAPLMLAGVRDILIITTEQGQQAHRQLLGSGEQFGIRLSYATQHKPRGIAEAFIIGQDFIAGSPSMLMLCDNIYYGGNLTALLLEAAQTARGAVVFACRTSQPQRFGIVEFSADGSAVSLEEKPRQPKSPYAVTGCYFYDERVCDYAAALSPSARGELEITDINRMYLQNNTLSVKRMGNDTAWFDAGTPDDIAEAANFVLQQQRHQKMLIACLEEIAWRQQWIDNSMLVKQAKLLEHTAYGQYLLLLAGCR